MTKKLYRLLLQCIPNNRPFDHFVAFITFLRLHRRLPTNKLLFNDVLYRIKTTDKIIDPLRVFVSDKEFVKLYVKAVAGSRTGLKIQRVLMLGLATGGPLLICTRDPASMHIIQS